MYIIGLTGGIASGKSTISNFLKELGAYVIDADEVAHQIMLPGQPAYKEIVDEFGPQVVGSDSLLNRDKLGDLVFHDPALRFKLNQITHHRVGTAFKECIKQAPAATEIAVWDVPLLIETGMHRSVNEVWVVWVDRETQKRRLMERNGLSEEAALSRINSQMLLDDKMKYADRLIDNTGSIEDSKVTVTRFYNQLLSIIRHRTIYY
ncbi:MAG: dephospho-CoA kinase [Candidatus Saccharibacteria bacterium]